MKSKLSQKLLAGILSVAMMLNIGITPVFAATEGAFPIGTSSVCTHHVHDENCGYTEGTPCTFDPATCEICNPQNTADADNIVTFAVEEVYAVYDTGTFYAATKAAPSTATETVISDADKKTINHLYINGASVPKELMFQSTTLKTVTCADTVTEIGLQAFSGCEGLTSAQLPKVTTIGGQAFRSCTGLANVEMSSATQIDGFAFQACAKLASVAMPNVTTIGNYAFSGCTSLTSLTSAQLFKVTTIGNNAFSDCINLESVEMTSATTIGNNAFSNCKKLASLTLGETPPTVAAADAFTGCFTPRTLTIQGNPDSQAVAVAAYKAVNDGNTGDELWYGWTLPNIKVAVPSAGTLEVTAGSSNPAYGTNNTITLTATFDKATNVGKQRALTVNKVEFNDGTAVLGNVTATQNDKGKWVATLNVDTKNWAVGAHNLTATFAGNQELVGSTTKDVTVTVNESYAVYDGSKFWRATQAAPSTATSEEITDKKTINHLYIMGESIPRDLMNSCTVLTSVKAPSTTTIGTCAFSGCTGLASLTLGATPPTVGADAFTGCPASRNLTIQGNPDSQAAAVAAYKAVNDGSTTDDKWYGWTLPNTINESYAVYDGSTFYAATKAAPSTATETVISDKTTITNLYIKGESVPTALMGDAGVIANTTLKTVTCADTVTSIGNRAFYLCKALTSVAMPSATTIGKYAFNECKGLKSVELPNAISIGINAFYYCESLTSANLPKVTGISVSAFDGCAKLANVAMPSATSIGKNAFLNCTSLISVSMPNAASISDLAFRNCTSLTSVEMSSATTIGFQTFLDCTALTSVAMPNVTEIGEWAFGNCTKLARVEMPKVITIGDRAFHGTALTSVSLPSVTTIGINAFEGCTGLISVEMPKVTSIASYAFNGCTGLASLTLGATPPATVDTGVFTSCPASRNLTIQGNPDSLAVDVAAYKAVNDGSTTDDKWYGWTLPNTINEVYAVYDGSSKKFYVATQTDHTTATTTVISDKKTINHLYIKGASVPDNLMYEWGNQCTKLKTVICADTVTTIGKEAFKKCIGLESVAMPNVTTIGESAFYGCTSLASIAMPKVEVISTSVFVDCKALTSVDVPSATSIGNQAFSGCKGLTSVTIPKATTIGNEAFKNCTSLTSAKLPSAITIDSNAFSDCTSLESVEMPKVTSIGSSAFYGCAKLASVAMPNVTKIGSYAFYDCTGLTSGAMPSAISIGNYAFNGCRRLTSVAMAKVTSIGENAFYRCTVLASLTLGATPPTVGTDAFTACSNSRTLTIQGNPVFQDTVLAAYKAAADGTITDKQWYGWTLPNTLDGTGVSNSAGTLEVTTGNSNPTFGAENTITITATFDKAAKAGKQRTLAINEVEFKDATTSLGTATATQNADGKWVATLNVNTKDWALGTHKLTATFAGNHELLGASTTNEVTVTVNESYAVYDRSKFWRATQTAPSTVTSEEITDKKTINNLYIMGASVPARLMYDWQNPYQNLKTVTCADTVTTIGKEAFYECTGLASVKLPKATSIGEQAFNGCTSLASVEMSSATTIGNDAFFGCTSLAIVEIPSATTIGDRAFNGCTKLTSAQLPKVTTIGLEAFSGCASLESVTMPKVTDIGEGAFSGCASLASVEMPEATNIGVGAFSGCTSLASVQLPKVTTIDNNAFYNCAKLASVAMPEVTSIGGGVFNNCKELASVEMPNVTTIGEYAFYNCAKLTSAQLPNVTSIGNFAFKNCTTLASLTLGATPPTVGGNAFTNCPKTNALTIQGNTAFKDTVLADYNTAAGNDGTADEKWYGWTLPTSLDSTRVSTSEGKLTAAGSVTVNYGTDNTITFTASFAKFGENKLRTLAENQISLLKGGVAVESKTATLKDGVYSAEFTVQTNAFTAGNYNYTATFDGNISLVGGTATDTVAVTINKIDQAALSFDGVPTTATYGDSKITLATKGGTGTGTVAYNSAAAHVVADDGTINGAGTATITATKAGDTNYNATTATTTITVNAAVPIIAWADAAPTETLTYTGSVAWITKIPTVTLVNSEPFHGTIQYAYKEKVPFSLFTGYTDGLPTNAGEYTIKAKIAAEGNYTEAESTNTMALTISRVDNNIYNRSTTSKFYGEDFLIAYEIVNKDTTQPTFTCEYKERSAAENTYTTTLPTNAGEYTMCVSATATQNYNACSAEQNFEIKKAPLNVTAGTAEPKKWDGTKTTIVTGLTFQNQITYKLLEENEKLAIGTDFIVTNAEYATANVGMNIIYATVALQNTTKANNYFLPSENGGVFPFTGSPIALADGPAAPTFSTMNDAMGKDTFTFNSTNATVYEYSKDSGATWTDITASGATTAINVGNVALAAGALQVRVKATATHNASGVLSNTAAQVFTATLEGSVSFNKTTDVTYGDTLTATASGTQAGAVLSYKWLAGTTELQSGTSNTLKIPGSAIGKVITVEVTAADYNGNLISSATNAVAKKAVTASASTVTKVYDGTDTATVSLSIGKVNEGDSITVTAPTATYDNANVGTGKAITLGNLIISGAAADWYTVTPPANVTGTITVKALTGATVTVGGTYIYTGTAITPTAENVTVKDGATTLVNGTDYGYAATDNTSAGAATVTVTFKGNYSGTASKTFTIDKAVPTYSIPTALTAKYGQPLSAVNISATNGFSWMDGTKSVGAVGTQTHKAKFTPTDTANYNTVENIDVTVTVGKADALALNSSAIMVKKQANYTVKLDMTAVSGYPAIPGGTPTFAIADSTSNGLIGTTIDVDGKTLVLVANNTTNDTADTVIVNVTGMGNYNDSTITVAVSYTDKTSVTITGVTVQDGTYHGGTQKGYIGTPTSAFSGSYDVTYTGRESTTYNSANAPKNTGDYTVTISVPDSDATYCGSISLNFTVSKATVTIKADNKSAYVGDTQPALTYTAIGLATGESLQTVPTLTCTSDMNKAGSYEIIVSGAAVPNTDNYNSGITYIAGTLTVSTRPSDGGGDDNSSGSGSTATPTPAPTPKATDGDNDTQKPKPSKEKPTVGKTTAAAEVDAQGKATVAVPEKSINDAITKAQQTAKKNGTEENGIAVEIEVTGGENINSVSTTLSEESIKELTTAGVKEVTFKSEMADVTLDLETLQQIQKEQGDDVTITVSKADVSSLDEKTKAEIGDRPVYELNLTRGDGTRVTNFDGSITIAIPYILQEGEDPANIAVVYINEKGEKEIMSGSGYDEKTQSVIFTTRHFSTFAIVLMSDKIDAPITDIVEADETTPDTGNENETANTQGGISTGIVVTIVIAAILAIAIVAGGVVVIVKKRRE